jgi:hypothetical protein
MHVDHGNLLGFVGDKGAIYSNPMGKASAGLPSCYAGFSLRAAVPAHRRPYDEAVRRRLLNRMGFLGGKWEASASLHYTAAVVLHDRELWLGQFEPERYDDPALRRYATQCVEQYGDPGLTAEQSSHASKK